MTRIERTPLDLVVALVVTLVAAPPPAAAQLYRPGHRVHLTGCDGARLTNPRIDLLDAPPGPGPAYFVARLRGTSEESLCDGDVVIVREVRRVQGRLVALVEPILEPGGEPAQDSLPEPPIEGWVRLRFLGAFFPLHECTTHFESRAAVEKCLHGDPRPR